VFKSIIQIPQVLQAHECKNIIAKLNNNGFEQMVHSYPSDYRNNDRSIIDSEDIAKQFALRLSNAIPQRIQDQHHHWWKYEGLNSHFRACRYSNGQSFQIHRDGAWSDSSNCRSFTTVMFYLNDGSQFIGGKTRFYPSQKGCKVGFRISPELGKAVIFGHHLWHDGEAVTQGSKYVLRTDIMYRREDENAEKHHLGYVWDSAQINDGRIITCSRDGSIIFWKIDKNNLYFLEKMNLGLGSITALANLSSSGFVSGTRSGLVQIWHEKQGNWKCTKKINGDGAVLKILHVKNGFVISYANGTIAFYDQEGHRIGDWSCGTSIWIRAIAISKDGSVYVALPDGDIRIITTNSAQSVGFIAGHPSALAISQNEHIAVGFEDGRVIVFNESEYTLNRKHDGAVRALIYHRKGALISTGEDNVILLEKEGRFVKHADFVTSLLETKSGGLISTSYDESVSLIQEQYL
jgi:WD40 repeat protein